MAPAGNPAQAVAVTNFRRHPVRFLSRAADGTLAFMQNGDIYTLRSGGRPANRPTARTWLSYTAATCM